MAKLSIASCVLLGVMAIVIRASATSGLKRKPAIKLNGSDEREDSISERINDPELWDYFMKDIKDQFKTKNSSRKLSEDDNIFEDDEDDEDGEDENEQYANYVKEETFEHYQELVTEDDDNLMTFEPTPFLTFEPTETPSFLGSSIWEVLADYDQSFSEDDMDDEDYDGMDSEDFYDNTIVLRLSLGVVNYGALFKQDYKDIIDMVLGTITEVLNNYTDVPFMVYDEIEYHRNNRGPSRNLEASVEAAENATQDRKKLHLADITLRNAVADVGGHGWSELSVSYSVWRRPRGGAHVSDDTQSGDKGERKLESWLQREANSRRKLGVAVENRLVLTKIERICNEAIQESLNNGVYWEALNSIHYGNLDLLLNGNIYYKDDKGLFDCKPVGDEYNLSEFFCPINRPETEKISECPVDAIVAEGQMPSSEAADEFVVPDNMVSSVISSSNDPTYPEVIAESLSDIEWGAREWVGLALMISTVVWTLVLSVTAHLIFKKRKRQILWGTALTPNGVDDILKVGWRVYEQPQQQSPEQILPGDHLPPQLFLQIYDKGQGLGYNDENSMLRGGVEQQQFFAASQLQNPLEQHKPP